MIDIVNPGGQVIVNDDGSTPFTKLITGGIGDLRGPNGLKNLSAMVGGWEGAFDLLINAMNGEVFGIELPLIGDKLKEEADFLGDMKQKVSSGLNALNDAGNILQDKVQEVIFAGLGPKGLNFIKDAHSEGGTLFIPDGKITKDDVGIRVLKDSAGLPTGFRFEMHLGKDIAFSTNPNFDIGVPGLDLKVDAPIQGNINLDFILMVGVDLTSGFFIETGMADPDGKLIGVTDAQGIPLTKEFSIGVNVSTPGLSAVGTLGFLKMGAKDLPGARIAALNPDGTTSFPLLVTSRNVDRSLEGVKIAYQTVAASTGVTASYDANTRTITFFVQQSNGAIVTTGAQLLAAAKATSFTDNFSLSVIGDTTKVIVPTGAILKSTSTPTSPAKLPVVIVPKSPDARLADVQFKFELPGTAPEAVIFDNVARTITFRVAANKTAQALVLLANDNAKSPSFVATFSAVLVDSSATGAGAIIDTASKQQNLGDVTKLAPSNFSARFEVDLKDSPTDTDTKLTIRRKLAAHQSRPCPVATTTIWRLLSTLLGAMTR